jgi:hypothetical protein
MPPAAWVFCVLVAAYALLPARWDPLIKWREHLDGWHDDDEA